MSTLLGLLAVALCFGFIILVHEMGHFLAARWAGVRCPQFAIGFGPRLGGFNWKGTDFSLRALPLGGYVLMVGEDPALEGAATWQGRFAAAVPAERLSWPITAPEALRHIAEPPDPAVVQFLEALPPARLHRSYGDLMGVFTDKTAWQKTVILLGGVFMNIVSAGLLFLLLSLTVGVGGGQNVEVRVGRFLAESPGQAAGIPVRSALLSVDGLPAVCHANFTDLLRDKAGVPVHIGIRTPAGEERDVLVTPDLVVAEEFQFRAGQPLRLVRAEHVPEGVTLPFEVVKVNGRPVSSLGDLETAVGTGKSHELKLESASGAPCLLKLPQGEVATRARGVLGMELAAVTTVGFERQATNTVVGVTPNSVAARLGVQPGDQLVLFQGEQIDLGRSALADVLAGVSRRLPARPPELQLVVLRGDQVEDLKLKEVPPATPEEFGVQLQPLTPGLRVQKAGENLWGFASRPFLLVWDLITNYAQTADFAKESVKGPVGIMQTIFEVSHRGLPELLWLLGILNTAVAAMNLLPIPALDGARCLFVWAGALRGRIINPDLEARIHFLGIVLLLTLAALITYRDTSKLLGGLFGGG